MNHIHPTKQDIAMGALHCDKEGYAERLVRGGVARPV